ncbi:MAG: heme-binding protein [Dehalococcoidia bacterium]
MTGLTFARAETILKAAFTKADELGVPMTVCLVDSGGRLVLVGRMDGAGWATVAIAQAMAETAAAYRTQGKHLRGAVQDRWFNTIEVAGGRPPLPGEAAIPFWLDGQFAGAIGVSGGSGEQDRACAVAGLAAVGVSV